MNPSEVGMQIPNSTLEQKMSKNDTKDKIMLMSVRNDIM